MIRFLATAIIFFSLVAPTPSIAAIGIGPVPVCYDFGCKTKDMVQITPEEWREVSGWFTPVAQTSEEERQQIKQAIGWMEVVVGKHTPTYRDTGLDLQYHGEFPGQLDCIDESLNTTTYLRLFESQGLFKYHKVHDRAYRRAILDQHWAGQIEDLSTGKRYAVDSWFQRNGILPYMQELTAWEDIPYFFSSYVDNSDEYENDGDAQARQSMWQSIKKRFKGVSGSSN
ncbi:MAG: hypothetical protein DHS20C01_25110 [marine bacterium B5-7]|nr:MAG: hypothetical protein DHS20C01_25110 [marine bacterium B5-7]